LEIPSYTSNKFLLGFFNSFFLCLPLSVAHIISARRLLVQGLPAGIFSNLGTICGQILLLICILFGGRFFIIPWFNFQILSYFFLQFSSIPFTHLIRRLNFSLITLILSFTFTSIPFYSFDYLILSNLGLVSQDKSLKNTVFSPTKIHDYSSPLLGDSTNL